MSTVHCDRCGKDFVSYADEHVFPTCPYCNPLPLIPRLLDTHGSGLAPSPFEERECSTCRSNGLLLMAQAKRITELTEERDEARSIARCLASAYEHDSRPLPQWITKAKAYPMRTDAVERKKK